MMNDVDRREFLVEATKTTAAILTGGSLLRSTENLAAEEPNGVHADPRNMKAILILDRESVAEAEGVTFHLNQAKKHPENPVLAPGAAHEWDGLQVTWPGTVLYDAEDKLFRCWYSGMDAVQKNRPPYWVPGYAESKDGIHWTKPDLGQAKHRDLPTNRIIVDWSDKMISLVTLNPDRSDPERKFLALWHWDQKGFRKILASSPDGKVWKNEGVAFVPEDEERISFFDIYQLIFQPDAADENDRVIGYAQVYRERDWGGGRVRQIGMVHGPHAGKLTPIGPKEEDFIVLRPEKGIDEELHFASVLKVGDQSVMLFESDRFTQDPLHGDLRLAISGNGRNFRRVHKEKASVATGPKGMWDENLLVTTSSSMQEVGDEIWIYYFGCPGVYRRWPYGHTAELRASFYYPSYLGIAVLPRDRFGYAEGPGSVTTNEITLGPAGLWVNAEGDGVKVSCLSTEGKVTAEGRLVNVPGEAIYRKVEWTSGTATGTCRVRIGLGGGERVFGVRY